MNFQPPPTWALPVIADEATGRGTFNPIWLKWFVDLAGVLSKAGFSSAGGLHHNDLAGLQGGRAEQFYHLTQDEYTGLANSVIPATRGGTGLTTVAIGDLLYGIAVNTWAQLAAGTAGYFLKSGGPGVAPAWAGIAIADVAGLADAWIAYTPTVTPASGAFTTLGAVSGRYKQVGKTVFLQVSITITTNGTAAGAVVVTLPGGMTFAAETSMNGREYVVSTVGLITYNAATASNFGITTYAGAYPGANGARLVVSGVIEIA